MFMILKLDLYLCAGDWKEKKYLGGGGLMVTMIGHLGLPLCSYYKSLILVEFGDHRDNIQIKAQKGFPSLCHQSYPVIWQSHLHYELSSCFGDTFLESGRKRR